jgi:hypothetical protein
MSKLEISTRVKRLSTLLKEFEEGKILIPPFQRDYVWNNSKKIELLDSLNRGFPIGSVLFWMPEKKVRENFYEEDSQLIGGYKIKNVAPEYYFILDGFQRLSTLFGCFINKNATSLDQNEELWKNQFNIYYDLKEDKFEFNRKIKSSLQIYQIPLFHFFDGDGYFELSDKLLTSIEFSKEEKLVFLERYKSFANKIGQYDIPVMELYGGDVSESVNIFSRLNSRGEMVSDDWKVSALSFNKERNFRFGTEIDNLFTYLERFNFYTSKEDRKNKRKFILDCVLNSISDKPYFDVANTSEELEKLASDSSFIDISLEAISTVKETIKFLYENLLILNNKFISSTYQITFLLDFFKNESKQSIDKVQELKKWFWITSYTNYFTIYNLTDIREAYKVFQDFVENNNSPIYKKNFLKVKTFPEKNNFGSSRYTSLALFMVNYSINKENILTSKPIDTNKITGVNEYKLFRNENSIGNTIFIPIQKNELNEQIKKHNSLQFLLSNDFRGQYQELFITDDMRDLHSQKKNKELLKLREKLIQDKENEFITKVLNLELE